MGPGQQTGGAPHLLRIARCPFRDARSDQVLQQSAELSFGVASRFRLLPAELTLLPPELALLAAELALLPPKVALLAADLALVSCDLLLQMPELGSQGDERSLELADILR